MPNKTLEKWEEKKLGEICDLQNGFAFSSKDYVKYSNTLNIRMSNIRPNGYFDENHNIKYLPDNYAELYKDFKLHDGDLIIAMTDMANCPKILGVPTVVKHTNSNQIFLMNQRVGRLFNFSKDIDVSFLKYLLISPYVRKKYRAKGQSLQLNISKSEILSIKIKIPPLQEQQRIVGILDEAFENIEKAKQNALQNLNNVKELFESHLNKTFLNIDKNVNKKLSELAQIIGGGTPSKDNKSFYIGDIPWATVRDMNADLLTGTEFLINEDAVKNSSTNIIPAGNIIIATRVGLGKVCILAQDTAINQDLKGIMPVKQITSKFLFWWFKSIKNKIIEAGVGATVKGVKLPFIQNLDVPFVNIKEQQKIVAQLGELQEQTKKLEQIYKQKIKDLDELKQSILQKAFNGEL